MPRYALLIEYNGGPYQGWQRQLQGQPSVQAALEAAFALLETGPHTVAAAGRTDAGVHASGQVAHIDLNRDWDTFKLIGALNHHLRPHPVTILDIKRVADDFHARFSATERRYLFRVVARRPPVTYDKGFVWQVGHPLDLNAMRDAAAQLLGTHDFTTFRSSHCQAKSPLKTMDDISISEHDFPHGIEYRFRLRARSFLHNQVRSIVGSLERVGAGYWHPDRMGTALAAQNRAACGPVCPPDGLYLVGVGYAENPFAPSASSL